MQTLRDAIVKAGYKETPISRSQLKKQAKREVEDGILTHLAKAQERRSKGLILRKKGE